MCNPEPWKIRQKNEIKWLPDKILPVTIAIIDKLPYSRFLLHKQGMGKQNKLRSWFSRLFTPTEKETVYLHKGEILVIFLIGFFIALSLWMLINLGKEYSVTVELPVSVTGQNDELMFAEPPPESVQVAVTGEGWNLISIYRSPPEIKIPYEEGVLNLSDFVEDYLAGYSGISVQKVEPSLISLALEQRARKRVPVSPNLDIRFKARFEQVGELEVSPDSVTVSGPSSVIDTLQSWPTEFLRLHNVQSNIDRSIPLMESDQISLQDTSAVHIFAEVAEFTEGDIRIYVRTVDVPEDVEIRFNPSVITVRYDVPIEFFSDVQDMVPYEAVVPYEEILRDTTGVVRPEVRPVTDEFDLRLRSYQPRRVSWFRVIP